MSLPVPACLHAPPAFLPACRSPACSLACPPLPCLTAYLPFCSPVGLSACSPDPLFLHVCLSSLWLGDAATILHEPPALHLLAHLTPLCMPACLPFRWLGDAAIIWDPRPLPACPPAGPSACSPHPLCTSSTALLCLPACLPFNFRWLGDAAMILLPASLPTRLPDRSFACLAAFTSARYYARTHARLPAVQVAG